MLAVGKLHALQPSVPWEKQEYVVNSQVPYLAKIYERDEGEVTTCLRWGVVWSARDMPKALSSGREQKKLSAFFQKRAIDMQTAVIFEQSSSPAH